MTKSRHTPELKMANKFQKGDRVEWNTSGGKTQGVIKDIITQPTEFKNHHFEASKDDPRYVVESEKSGAQAVHKATALEKID